MQPWLSVVMPTFNGGRFLRAALDSIVSQNDAPIEIIAVDDGSTDDTLDILREYSARLPLSVVSRPHSGNWVAGTNVGLIRASGEWVCFLHQDDGWLPNRLARLHALTESFRDVVLFLHASRYVDSEGTCVGTWSSPAAAGPAASAGPRPGAIIGAELHRDPGPPIPPRGGREDRRHERTALVYGRLGLLALPGRARQRLSPSRGPLLVPDSSHVADGPGGPFGQRLPAANAGGAGSPLGGLCGPLARPLARVTRAARFSVEVNAHLKARFHGDRLPLSPLARQAAFLGPQGLYRFLRDSRILDRVRSRLKARDLLPTP